MPTRFANLSPEDRRQFKIDHQNRKCGEVNVDLSDNSDNIVDEDSQYAHERTTEKRVRSVFVSREYVKQKTDPYLRQLYTQSDGRMICQICKSVLPFKFANGLYYFEAVEFLEKLNKRYYQNYIALCPNHAAMFKYANDSRNELIKELLELDGNDIKVVLTNKTRTIHFTNKHIMDLKKIIQTDTNE